MGKTALRSHATGIKHRQRAIQHTNESILQHLEPSSASSHCSSSMESSNTSTAHSNHDTNDHASTSSNTATSSSLDSYVVKRAQLKAESLWALKTVNSNFSFHSNNDISSLFASMFPDSVIAQNMSCAETKSMYLSCFGIAPYFIKLLETKVRDKEFVLMFDETFNREMQKKQMDFLLRFWDGNQVNSRFYTSDFIGHGRANDLLESFEKHIGDKIGYKHLLQVSMDGPNTNWSLFNKLQSELECKCNKKLINTGSCGLHTVHNSFKYCSQAMKWDVSHFLSSLYTLFNETPARREDFEKATDAVQFPLPFCNTRWLENINVAERAMSLMDPLVQYVKVVNEGKLPNPGTKSFEFVQTWIKDPLALAKLAAFNFVAAPVEAFLSTYQTDKPMMPFLSSDIESLLRSLLKRFIKSDVLEKISSPVKLLKLDPTLDENCKSIKTIDVGFIADRELKAKFKSKVVSDRDLVQFRMQYRDGLINLVNKIKDKTPITYSIVRNLSCLAPNHIIHFECSSQFKTILHHLVEAGRVNSKECDELFDQYCEFTREAEHLAEFKNFKKNNDRLDSLYYSTLGQDSRYSKLWDIIKKLLMLSHGQAPVERGFSINKDVSVENLSEHNLIARRIIKDHIQHVGGMDKVLLTKEMLDFVAGARRRYQSHLEEQRVHKVRVEKGLKRKNMEAELEQLRKKKKDINDDISFLTGEADKLAEKAENTRKIDLILKSNSLRRSAKDKLAEVARIDKKIVEMQQNFDHTC